MPIPSTHISLLCDIREGGDSDSAWEAFHARYRDVISGWCLRHGLPPDRAEDLTQDVLLKLFQQLPHYNHDPERGRFRSWLKTVVNNALTDFWRRQQRHPEGAAVGGTAFHQTMVEQQPAAAVAAALNLSVASVYKATYRVKQMLLEEYRDVHPAGAAPNVVSEARDAGGTPV